MSEESTISKVQELKTQYDDSLNTEKNEQNKIKTIQKPKLVRTYADGPVYKYDGADFITKDIRLGTDANGKSYLYEHKQNEEPIKALEH
tara:strand:- start:256 stop:522 length:267 start_codon:yes stop_codon:yes gene_type:complete